MSWSPAPRLSSARKQRVPWPIGAHLGSPSMSTSASTTLRRPASLTGARAVRVDRSRKEAQAAAGVHVLAEDEEAIHPADDGRRTIASRTPAWSCEPGAAVLSLLASSQLPLQANQTDQYGGKADHDNEIPWLSAPCTVARRCRLKPAVQSRYRMRAVLHAARTRRIRQDASCIPTLPYA